MHYNLACIVVVSIISIVTLSYFLPSRSSIDQMGIALAVNCGKRAFDLFIFYFLGYLRGDTPILKASFAVGVRARPEGQKRGACLMIIFHQFLPPDLYYYPTFFNPTEITRAHHQADTLPPSGVGIGVGQSQKREGILSGQAARKSYAEGRGINGNGRSVLHEVRSP
jgi:hypothetical protein